VPGGHAITLAKEGHLTAVEGGLKNKKMVVNKKTKNLKSPNFRCFSFL